MECDDGDPFSRHFATAGSPLYVVLKLIGLLVPLSVALGIWATGFANLAAILTFVYCIPLFFFMVFFTFLYDSVRYPTITTFVRSTLGLGIPLFPLYSLTIAIGAWRCQRLLESQD